MRIATTQLCAFIICLFATDCVECYHYYLVAVVSDFQDPPKTAQYLCSTLKYDGSNAENNLIITKAIRIKGDLQIPLPEPNTVCDELNFVITTDSSVYKLSMWVHSGHGSKAGIWLELTKVTIKKFEKIRDSLEVTFLSATKARYPDTPQSIFTAENISNVAPEIKEENCFVVIVRNGKHTNPVQGTFYSVARPSGTRIHFNSLLTLQVDAASYRDEFLNGKWVMFVVFKQELKEVREEDWRRVTVKSAHTDKKAWADFEIETRPTKIQVKLQSAAKLFGFDEETILKSVGSATLLEKSSKIVFEGNSNPPTSKISHPGSEQEIEVKITQANSLLFWKHMISKSAMWHLREISIQYTSWDEDKTCYKVRVISTTVKKQPDQYIVTYALDIGENITNLP